MYDIENIFKDLELREQWEKLPKEIQQYYIDVKTGKKALTLTNDYVFKRIFDPDIHRDRLSELLSLILKQKVKVLHSLRNENTPASIYSKKMIMDIAAQLAEGEYCIVEMQVTAQNFIDKRLAVYSSDFVLKQYSVNYNQTKKNLTFNDLKKVYTIVLMVNSPNNFKENCYNCHHFKQISDTGLELNLLQEYIFVELEDYTEIKEIEQLNMMDVWLLFIVTDNRELKEKLIKKYPKFKIIYEEAMNMLKDRKEMLGMFATDLALMEEKSLIEQGRQEGRQEGEYMKSLDIAKNMIAENIPLQVISRLTGLPVETVEKLANTDTSNDISSDPHK